MDSEILFEEVQGFDNKGFQSFLKIATGIVLLCCIIMIFFNRENENSGYSCHEYPPFLR